MTAMRAIAVKSGDGLDVAALIRQTTLHALRDGVAVHDELDAVHPSHPTAALARAGDLRAVLGSVARDADERAAFKRIEGRPNQALRLARALTEAAAKARAFSVDPIRNTLVYFTLVFAVESMGAAMVGMFVSPVLGTMQRDGSAAAAAAPGHGDVLVAVSAAAALCALVCVAVALRMRMMERLMWSDLRAVVVDAIADGGEDHRDAVQHGAGVVGAALERARVRADRAVILVRLGGTVVTLVFAAIIMLSTYLPIVSIGSRV